MADVKEHYDNHLGSIYSWMIGSFADKVQEFKSFLLAHNIQSHSTGIALDLGSGHGIQAVALAQLGFQVTAIDFNQHLCDELKSNAEGLLINVIEGDIRTITNYPPSPELVLCCGDTLTHLNDKQEVEQVILDIASSLERDGKLILSFRDYSKPLLGTDRFIPVKNDDNRLLTCFLEYEAEHVVVTDLLQERSESGWLQRVSSYRKVRIETDWLIELLKKNGFHIDHNQVVNRLITIMATKVSAES